MLHFWLSNLGTITLTKLDEFSENFQRGGGVISDPKNFVADFSIINEHFLYRYTMSLSGIWVKIIFDLIREHPPCCQVSFIKPGKCPTKN